MASGADEEGSGLTVPPAANTIHEALQWTRWKFELRRVLGALVVVGVLVDASACIVAFARVDAPLGQIAISALCPCGCKAHTGALAGVGITQLAALPAEAVLPDRPRIAPERGAPRRPSLAPVREIDHVPILLA